MRSSMLDVISWGFFKYGEFKPTTAVSDETRGMPAYEVAEPQPSGKRNIVCRADLGRPWRTTEVVGGTLESAADIGIPDSDASDLGVNTSEFISTLSNVLPKDELDEFIS